MKTVTYMGWHDEGKLICSVFCDIADLYELYCSFKFEIWNVRLELKYDKSNQFRNTNHNT